MLLQKSKKESYTDFKLEVASLSKNLRHSNAPQAIFWKMEMSKLLMWIQTKKLMKHQKAVEVFDIRKGEYCLKSDFKSISQAVWREKLAKHNYCNVFVVGKGWRTVYVPRVISTVCDTYGLKDGEPWRFVEQFVHKSTQYAEYENTDAMYSNRCNEYFIAD
jgi:hypothetical protein